GEAVVVALLLLLGEPDAAEGVLGVVGGYLQPATVIGGLAVGIARAVGDPQAAAGAQDRIERGDQAAGRPDPPYAVPVPCSLPLPLVLVDVGLTVRDDHQPRVLEQVLDQMKETIAVPFHRRGFPPVLDILSLAQILTAYLQLATWDGAPLLGGGAVPAGRFHL